MCNLASHHRYRTWNNSSSPFDFLIIEAMPSNLFLLGEFENFLPKNGCDFDKLDSDNISYCLEKQNQRIYHKCKCHSMEINEEVYVLGLMQALW